MNEEEKKKIMIEKRKREERGLGIVKDIENEILKKIIELGLKDEGEKRRLERIRIRIRI